MNNQSSKRVCPSCKENFKADEELKAVLPFCSKRCKMIDLSKWLGQKYVITKSDEASIYTTVSIKTEGE